MLDPNAQAHFNARLRRTNVVPGMGSVAPQAPAGTGGFNPQHLNGPTQFSGAPPQHTFNPQGMGGHVSGLTHSPGLGFQRGPSPLGRSQASPYMTGQPMGDEGGRFDNPMPIGPGRPLPIPEPSPRQRGFEDRPQDGEPTGFRLPPQVDFQPRPMGGEAPWGGMTTGPMGSPANPAGYDGGGINPGGMYTGGFNQQTMGGGVKQDLWQKMAKQRTADSSWDGWSNK